MLGPKISEIGRNWPKISVILILTNTTKSGYLYFRKIRILILLQFALFVFHFPSRCPVPISINISLYLPSRHCPSHAEIILQFCLHFIANEITLHGNCIAYFLVNIFCSWWKNFCWYPPQTLLFIQMTSVSVPNGFDTTICTQTLEGWRQSSQKSPPH
jgi:hypothetical protein